jgi:hypothetical protein
VIISGTFASISGTFASIVLMALLPNGSRRLAFRRRTPLPVGRPRAMVQQDPAVAITYTLGLMARAERIIER